MTTAEKIDAYLDGVLRYLATPWSQRDPGEYEALMAMKAKIYSAKGGTPDDETQVCPAQGPAV